MFNFNLQNRAFEELNAEQFRIIYFLNNTLSMVNEKHNTPDNNKIEMFNGYMMNKLGLCERQVQRLIKGLEKLGYITVERTIGRNAAKKPNIITLNVAENNDINDAIYCALYENSAKNSDINADINVTLNKKNIKIKENNNNNNTSTRTSGTRTRRKKEKINKKEIEIGTMDKGSTNERSNGLFYDSLDNEVNGVSDNGTNGMNAMHKCNEMELGDSSTVDTGTTGHTSSTEVKNEIKDNTSTGAFIETDPTPKENNKPQNGLKTLPNLSPFPSLNEIWKDIEGYDGYQVSNKGNVKRLARWFKTKGQTQRWRKEFILTPTLTEKGYQRVDLHKDGRRKRMKVHRLVAMAFIPNPDNLPQVNHKDENKQNNCVDNLEWCTNQYNVTYSMGKPVIQYTTDGTIVKRFDSILQAERETGCSDYTITRSCNGYETTLDCKWKYAEPNDWVEEAIFEGTGEFETNSMGNQSPQEEIEHKRASILKCIESGKKFMYETTKTKDLNEWKAQMEYITIQFNNLKKITPTDAYNGVRNDFKRWWDATKQYFPKGWNEKEQTQQPQKKKLLTKIKESDQQVLQYWIDSTDDNKDEMISRLLSKWEDVYEPDTIAQIYQKSHLNASCASETVDVGNYPIQHVKTQQNARECAQIEYEELVEPTVAQIIYINQKQSQYRIN